MPSRSASASMRGCPRLLMAASSTSGNAWSTSRCFSAILPAPITATFKSFLQNQFYLWLQNQTQHVLFNLFCEHRMTGFVEVNAIDCESLRAARFFDHAVEIDQ